MGNGNVGDLLAATEVDAAKIRFAVKSTYPEMKEWQWIGLINRIFLPLEITRESRIELPGCVEFDSKTGKLILSNSERARQLIEAVL